MPLPFTILTASDFRSGNSSGRKPEREEWVKKFPEVAEGLRAYFADEDQFSSVARSLNQAIDGEDIEANCIEKIRYFGDYELLSEIARGGMGVVYKARQVSLNRIVGRALGRQTWTCAAHVQTDIRDTMEPFGLEIERLRALKCM